ncbi:MAG: type II secretion system F family protein [Aquificae bacterium]|nr:type II secretion system F family protein [Aquificota bacterium]
MPLFKYKAITEDGRVVEGEGEFASLAELAERLQKENLTLIASQKVEEKKPFSLKLSIPFLGGISDRDWAILCRQLSVLVGAGVGLVEALELVAEQVPNRRLRQALLEVAREIEEGSSFHAALAKRRDVFPELLINLVAVGEETGELDVVLRRASEYYEKMAFIKGKIKSASFYPTFVFVIATLIVVGILTFVVPKFESIYRTLGGELPLPTQMLIRVSNFLKENLPLFMAVAVFTFIVLSYLYARSYGFRKRVHELLLRVPKFNELFEKAALARFSRTMATLFSAGVPIDRALQISAKVVGLIPIQEAVEKALQSVLEGKPLWKALQETGRFPRIIVVMIRVGEETGQLDEMLNTIANFFEEEVDRFIEALISLIEPVLIVFLGVVVGLILIALYLPIFEVGKLIVR